MLIGGFPYVIEAVGGLESVTESMRLVDNWGTVLFIGAGGLGEVDLSALWFKEAELVGAWNHAQGVHPVRELQPPAGGLRRQTVVQLLHHRSVRAGGALRRLRRRPRSLRLRLTVTVR